MAKTLELGIKHECPSCSTKYYDLGKGEAPCPKCGTPQGTDEDDPAPTKKKKK